MRRPTRLARHDPRIRHLLAAALALGVAPALGCKGREGSEAPRAEFLVVGGDSTFWVRSGSGGTRVRGSPIQLARFGGRFREVYLVDDDRSFYDALFVGERVFVRDIIAGDSALAFDDTVVPALARGYARAHPTAEPLGPDEEASDDPSVDVSASLQMLELHGPFLSFEYRVDGDGDDGEWHTVRHGVIDLRAGRVASLAGLFGDSVAARVLHEGGELYSEALDSVLASRDARARDAARALAAFRYDSAGFILRSLRRAPAVEFVAAGHGERAGGLELALDPIPVRPPTWWDEVRETLPVVDEDSTVARWSRPGLAIVARTDSGGATASLAIVDSAGRRWPVGRISTPVRRLFWLDRPPVDSVTRHALARAFDDAALYSEDATTAMRERGGGGVGVVRCCALHAVAPHLRGAPPERHDRLDRRDRHHRPAAPRIRPTPTTRRRPHRAS